MELLGWINAGSALVTQPSAAAAVEDEEDEDEECEPSANFGAAFLLFLV